MPPCHNITPAHQKYRRTAQLWPEGCLTHTLYRVCKIYPTRTNTKDHLVMPSIRHWTSWCNAILKIQCRYGNCTYTKHLLLSRLLNYENMRCTRTIMTVDQEWPSDLTHFFRFFIPCIFYTCYNKNYQQMRLFVLCPYFLFLAFSLHVSGLHGPIIRGVSSCCFYATIWFLCWTRNNTMLIVTI